ncbi:MAG: VCBS repeat-containing protein [Cyclobacteriaceae bacterium]
MIGCQQPEEAKLFRLVPSEESGISFANELKFDEDFNIFKYRNFYNGGGVALADFNGDQLLDIYLVSNMSSNKLFQNKGNLKFEDVTSSAGVAGVKAWSTGVSVVDINGDGHLDIYVCNSGDIKGDNKQNELFINQGDNTFTEEAEEYGIADRGFSTHAAFFDYDKDGDVDMYLLNNSYNAIGSFNLRRNERPNRDSVGGDKLYRNDNGVFTDVSVDAGIYGSIIGFGLGVTVGDVDKDGWLDIYVSNDFFERDYLYINNKDGRFNEVLEERIKSTSAASMGADMADLNNDGNPEVFVTDMLPGNNERIKTVTTFDSWDRYMYSVQNGYGNQFTRNTLQLNNGDNTFSEIGRYSGVEASDWSWGALIFDFDNDGFKDIFIANGIYQDLTNQDFLQFVTQNEITKKITSTGKVDYKQLIDYIPSMPISNHAYLNNRDLTFKLSTESLGLSEVSFSSGSAYGDLDNDGDLDLVVNNTNMPFFMYENQSEQMHPENRYVKFELKGESENTNALGTNISVYVDGTMYYLEHLPTRGFESTVDNRPLIGVGSNKMLDSVLVVWPSGKKTRLYDVQSNQVISLNEKDSKSIPTFDENSDGSMFFAVENPVPDYIHKENDFVDFDRDRLTFQMISSQGPCLCKGDINNDGLDDIYLGGAADEHGFLGLQQQDGTFKEFALETIKRDAAFEDVDCAMFDANGDGKLDLYVVSGGNEFDPTSPYLSDRLYLGDERGFERQRGVLPVNRYESTSVVVPADYDKDGDIDLFVGGRLKTYSYGFPRNGYILNNDGNANFTNVADDIAPDLFELGMITDAQWSDIDGDDDLDLVIVGEWMPITIFKNNQGVFEKQEPISASAGWWNTVEIADLNYDGLPDLVVGNHGQNSRFEASDDYPLHMFINDFDNNGTIEQVICQYEGDKLFPLPLRHDLSMQMPFIKKKYLKYDSYKDQEITEVFNDEVLSQARVLKAHNLKTSVYLNKSNDIFESVDLPPQVQFSCTYAIAIADFDNDDILDILTAGNLYDVKPEMGRYDASYGTLLKGDGSGQFDLISNEKSGLFINKQVRRISQIKTKNGYSLMIANNDDKVQAFVENNEPREP